MLRTISLNENHMFRRLYRVGKSAVSPCAAVYVKKNRLGINRLGLTAAKKLGGAVQRNRARRVIREAYRLMEPRLRCGYDIVVVARKRALDAKTQEVGRSLARALGELSLLE